MCVCAVMVELVAEFIFSTSGRFRTAVGDVHVQLLVGDRQ